MGRFIINLLKRIMVKAMTKKILIFIVFVSLLLITSCASGPRPEPGSGSPPVIDEYFASPTVGYGTTWKLFIKAHDPDGDMWQIQFQMKQPYVIYNDLGGYVFLTRSMKESMDGFCYMLTPRRPLPEVKVDLTVAVTIIDRAKNKSNTIEVPLSLGMTGAAPDPDNFANKSLIPIPYLIKSKFDAYDN